MLVEKILRRHCYHLPENWKQLTIMKLKVHMIQFVRETASEVEYSQFINELSKVSNPNLMKMTKQISMVNQHMKEQQ